jgi:sialic acid synthase SpsE
MALPIFISEVSSNHSKSKVRCIDFIKKSSEIGCEAVKFQLFKIKELFSEEAYKKKPELLKREEWELPLEFLPDLSTCCKDHGIQFGCTPFYLNAVDELYPFVDFYKIASYELLWEDLLKECAKTKKPVILSTGMANLSEISRAVDVLKSNGCINYSLLHCVSGYPTPIFEANLMAIKTLAEEYKCITGWSDHSVNPGVLFRAIYKWDAQIIEFHLDLDGDGDEFKTGHCWLPEQISYVIKYIREGISSDGDGIKIPTISELPDRSWRADPHDGLRPLVEMRQKLIEK